ncbi:hypothetical protein LRH25_12570 [Ideonella azotifigens]|uniref:Uncharacterized protein n=1 Tax=Ideonella azotifigens TaxID=513160 RepID=A0ABN1KBU8_9BURK|nr:hypothetical protein [Ideonella azotifigens]MCD2341176.1 hypothetical protein [Ideonella azotifigens]
MLILILIPALACFLLKPKVGSVVAAASSTSRPVTEAAQPGGGTTAGRLAAS